jgi:anti-anti-sigma regulatory factor/CHASE3 domain sensor protein
MRLRTLMTSVLVLQLLLLAGVGVVLVRLGNAQDTIVSSQEQAVASRALAAELRQSSDDLTRFARTFVVTGDQRYLRYFNMVLAIRNGELARPSEYDGPYWDAVIAGSLPEPTGTAGAVSLRQRMEAVGFTQQELGLLETAQERSDALVALEERAFALMERYLRAGDTAARESALELMHGPDYHASKESIMAPIGEFEDVVDSRATRRLHEANSGAARYRIFLLVLTSGMFLLLLGATWATHHRILRRAGALASAARDIQTGKLGVRSGVSGDDELGELGHAFDAMVDELGGALGSAQLDSARSKSILDALVRSNPDGVIEVNAETGLIRSFNPAARTMLGEVLAPGEPFDTLFDSRKAGYDSLEDLASRGIVEELDLRGPHGETVRVEMRVMIVEDGDERIAVLAARDLGKWKRELDARYDEILQLSAPVIELETGVLLVPVVGNLTSQRATKLRRSVLEAIEARSARYCVIDIRGITSMDADVGSHLVRVVSAAQLMGCTPVLSGLTPETVQRMYDSDVSWERVVTVGSLRQAVAWVRDQTVQA